MRKEIQKKFKEKIPNGRLIYLTKTGSHLFGLNNENSDTDIKGIFLPSKIDTYKIEPENIDLSTNKTNANNKEDLDITLISIQKFFKLLQNGDTNAYDLLFSMFSEKTILIETKESNIIKKHYRELLSENIKNILKYITTQTKKYGIKGARTKELTEVINITNDYMIKNPNPNIKIDELIDIILNTKKYKYIKEIRKEDVRNGANRYISILDREYQNTQKILDFKSKLDKLYESYGERSKKSAKGIDFKALSHAYRVVLEMKELVDTHFITFPLKEKEKVLKIKNKDLSDFNNSYEDILSYLESEIKKILKEIPQKGFQKEIKEGTINKLLIKILSIPNFKNKTRIQKKNMKI